MHTLSVWHLIVDGLVLSTALGLLILFSLYWNPRVWIQDFPAPLRAALPPLSAVERRQRAIFGVLLIGVLIGGMLVSAWRLRTAMGGSLAFSTVLFHLYGLFTMFNLWDTLIVDCLVLVALCPRWALPLPEARGGCDPGVSVASTQAARFARD